MIGSKYKPLCNIFSFSQNKFFNISRGSFDIDEKSPPTLNDKIYNKTRYGAITDVRFIMWESIYKSFRE